MSVSRQTPEDVIQPEVALAKHAARRTVAGRLSASFFIVLVAFAMTVGWSFQALREAARDATMVRDAYVPLLSLIGEALAGQNIMNAQLNHITSAKNPDDVKQWIETARRVRPRTFRHLREQAQKNIPTALDPTGLRQHVIDQMHIFDRQLDAEQASFKRLFQALNQQDLFTAERVRDALIATQTEGAKRLRDLRQRVSVEMASLTEAAQIRERRSIQLLVGLSLVTLIVGFAISLYARRVLAPLSTVTQRARAVAAGDLRPHEWVATDDEIGELAETFEGMVAAIRKARSELVQAERLATIGKMAAHITHEVRNPLSSIGLNLELLEEEIAEVGSEQESMLLLLAIKREVEHLSQISEQYLSAVREPVLSLERENIGDLIRDLHAFMRPEIERAGLTSDVQVEGEPVVANVDEAPFRQALFNLIRNAREALPKGGHIRLIVDRSDDDGVQICVEDNGDGIPAPKRTSIFDPFYTSKRHGTGLGLAVTRSIIDAHGGTISCHAREGGGTRFCITLPSTS